MDENQDIARANLRELSRLETRRRPLDNVHQKIMELMDPPNAFITKEYNAKDIWKVSSSEK